MARRVNVSDLLPEPIELTMPDNRVFSITLGVNQMLELFSAEEMLGSSSNEGMMDALVAANTRINDLLEEHRTDDGPPPNYDLPVETIGLVFAALAGADVDSIAEEIRGVLADLSSGAKDDSGSGSKDGSSDEVRPGGPLAKTKGRSSRSTKRSPSSSSASGSPAAGRRRGGSTRASSGASSARTSAPSRRSATA